MELRHALKEQYHAGLMMLAECVEVCPDSLWIQGKHPRTFWRIAFHAAFFTQLYLGQNEEVFRPWPGRRVEIHHNLWEEPANVEPYELPEGADIYTIYEMLDYIGYINQLVDPIVDTLDLDAVDTGFPWYKGMSKLSHEIMNIRHLQGHVGQLSEILMVHGVDTHWLARRNVQINEGG